MLAEPEPKAFLVVTAALRHFGRAIAFAATGRLKSAKAEQQAFVAARGQVPKNRQFASTSAAAVLDVAEKMIEGEILYRDGRIDAAVSALRNAVSLEDGLPYSEPPCWLVPVRHALGATLMDVGRYAEAEAVYRDDLRRRPENGWSLLRFGPQLEDARTQNRSVACESSL